MSSPATPSPRLGATAAGPAGVGLAVFVVTLIVYARTLCPTVAAGDSGELATAAARLGIAHPPGFPLWTLLGRVAAIVGPDRPIIALNALSALCVAGAAALATLLLHRVTGRLLVSAGVALAFAFSRAVWDTAVVTEVYALNLLVTVAALTAGIYARSGRSSFFVLAAYLVGLGVGNHPFALLAAPPIALCAFLPGDGAVSWRRVPAFLGAFLLGLSVYLYLPVRWSAGPDINWGGIRATSDLVDHVLRTQYGGLGEAAAHTSLALRFRVMVGVLGKSVPLPLAIAGLAGAAMLLRRRPFGIALALVTLFVVAGPLTAALIRYEDTFLDRTVVTPFFLPAVLAVFLLAGVALAALDTLAGSHLADQPRATLVIRAALALLPPIFLAEANWTSCDRRHATLARDYGTRLLHSLPKDSRLFVEGDNELFTLLYLQRVENEREDVLLSDRTLNLLVQSYGDDFPVMSRAARRAAAPQRELEIAFAEKERPIFYAEEADLTKFGGCRLVPAGYVYQLLRPGEAPADPRHELATLPPNDPDDYLESHLAGVALYREGTWLAWAGRADEARDRYAEASQRAWKIPAIVRNCGLGWLELGDYAEAEKLFLRTIELEPHNQDALYNLAVLCTYTGRPQDASAYFAELDSLDTGLPEVPLSYAAVLLETGHLEEAAHQVDKALQLAPDLESAQKLSESIRRGLAIGGDEGLLEAQRSAGSLTVDGTLQLAQRYLDRGDWERATALYKEAAAQAPDRAGAVYGLGYGLLRVGRYRDAAAAFRKLLEIDPKSADGRNALAYVLAETGDSLAVAERLAQEALDLNPALGPYWRDTLGWVRYRAGRHEGALEALQEAERTLPVDDLSIRAENQYHLGKVMIALGRKDEAREYFRKSVGLAKSEAWVTDLKARAKELGVQVTS